LQPSADGDTHEEHKHCACKLLDRHHQNSPIDLSRA
jgi:hypothetical protein